MESRDSFRGARLISERIQKRSLLEFVYLKTRSPCCVSFSVQSFLDSRRSLERTLGARLRADPFQAMQGT